MRSTTTLLAGIFYIVGILPIFSSSSVLSQQKNLGKIEPLSSLSSYQASPGPVDGSSMASGLFDCLTGLRDISAYTTYLSFQHFHSLYNQPNFTDSPEKRINLMAKLDTLLSKTNPSLNKRLIKCPAYTALLKSDDQCFVAHTDRVLAILKTVLHLHGSDQSAAKEAKQRLEQGIRETNTYLNSLSISGQVRMGRGAPIYLPGVVFGDFVDGFSLGIKLLGGEDTGYSAGGRIDLGSKRANLITAEEALAHEHRALLKLLSEVKDISENMGVSESLADQISDAVQAAYQTTPSYAHLSVVL